MLFIEPTALNEMIADAVQTYPDECCGFFFGREKGKQRAISKIMVVHNSKEGDKRRRFEIAPKDYLKAELFAVESGLQLLGVYHSHPDHPAIPSEQDRVAAQPYFSYLIISINKEARTLVRSWQLNENFQFEEEKINQILIHQTK